MDKFGERNIGPDTGKKEPSVEELHTQLLEAEQELKRLPSSFNLQMRVKLLKDKIKILEGKK